MSILTAPDYSHFDHPQPELHRDPATVSAENKEVLALVEKMQAQLREESRLKRLLKLRRIMDEGFTGSPVTAAELGVEIEPAEANRVDAEWVVAPGAATNRRLLYIHGGAFAVGSPRSHRGIHRSLLQQEAKAFDVGQHQPSSVWRKEDFPDG